MTGTHFELMVQKAIAKAKDELAKVPIDQPLRDVLMKGQIFGLEQSLTIFRTAAGSDNEADL